MPEPYSDPSSHPSKVISPLFQPEVLRSRWTSLKAEARRRHVNPALVSGIGPRSKDDVRQLKTAILNLTEILNQSQN